MNSLNALQNGGLPALNAIKNRAEAETGQPQISGAHAWAVIASGELGKYLDAATEGDRAEFRRLIATSASPSQYRAVLANMMDATAERAYGQYIATGQTSNRQNYLKTLIPPVRARVLALAGQGPEAAPTGAVTFHGMTFQPVGPNG